MGNRKWVCIPNVTHVRSTDKAALYRDSDGHEFWCPWSQITDDSVDTDGKSGDLWIPRWLAEEKDLEFLEEEE